MSNASAVDVAEFILHRHGPMDAMKLQKLVYYAQAWSLAWTGAALFKEPIEAWANGPVVRSLYARHRGQYMVSTVGGNASSLTEKQAATIGVVTGHYAKWSGQQLSNLSHSEQPWIHAREGLGPTERGNNVIDPTDMQDFYGALSRQGK